MDVVEMAVREARRQMAEHLRTAAAESGEFIELYAQQFMSGSRSYPAAGVLMHTKMKALCRELVADELIYECGRGRR